MNEISYEEPRPDAARDLANALQQHYAAAPAQADALARGFLAQVQRDIDEQVDLRVQQQMAAFKPSKRAAQDQKELMLGSLGIGVPLTLFAGIFGGIPGIIVVWIGLVLINVAWAQRR